MHTMCTRVIVLTCVCKEFAVFISTPYMYMYNEMVLIACFTTSIKSLRSRERALFTVILCFQSRYAAPYTTCGLAGTWIMWAGGQ